jgi:hypothetical protein
VWRIRVVVDGRLVRNFDDLSYPSTLAGTIMWMGGKHNSLGGHTLTVLAYDRQHNVSQTSVSVIHGAKGARVRPGSSAAPGSHKASKHAKAKHRKRKAKKRRRSKRH